MDFKDEIKKLLKEYDLFGDAILDEIADEIIKAVRKSEKE